MTPTTFEQQSDSVPPPGLAPLVRGMMGLGSREGGGQARGGGGGGAVATQSAAPRRKEGLEKPSGLGPAELDQHMAKARMAAGNIRLLLHAKVRGGPPAAR